MTSTGIPLGVSLPCFSFILLLFHNQPPLSKIKHFVWFSLPSLIQSFPNTVVVSHWVALQSPMQKVGLSPASFMRPAAGWDLADSFLDVSFNYKKESQIKLKLYLYS